MGKSHSKDNRKTCEEMAGSTEENVLNLVLIGMTGEGKSSTGNTIVGNPVFTESSNMTSETKDVVSKFTRFDNFLVKVVDCPGLMDTDKDSGEDKTAAAANMAKALGMCNGGVDTFILVISRSGRFTEDHIKSLDALKKIFGDRYKENLIVVVTGGDTFKGDMEHESKGDIGFKEWCSQQSGAFKELFDQISDRFLLINNRENDPRKNKAQRRQIIQLVDILRTLNGRYTSKNLKEAKFARDQMIVQENLLIFNESLQIKIGLLSDDILKLRKSPSNKERGRILQSADELKKEITEKDKGTGLLNNLMESVEQVKYSVHDVDELHSLAKKLENIREEKSSWSRYGNVTAGITAVGGIGTVAAVAALAVITAPFSAGAAAAAGLISGAGYRFGISKTDQANQELLNLSKRERKIQNEMMKLDGKVLKATKQDIKY